MQQGANKEQQRNGTMMKRALECSLALLMAFSLMSVSSGRAAEGRTIRLSAHPEFPPFMYQQGDKMAGIIPELTERILSELGLSVQNTSIGPWARVQAIAQDGDIDVIAGIYKTNDRVTYLDFVPTPVIANEVMVWVKQGQTFPFASWEALQGRKMGGIIGDKYSPEFDAFLEQHADTIPIERVTSVEQNFKKLLAGRIDFMIYSRYVGMLVAQKMGITDQIEVLPKVVFTGLFYVAFSKKSDLKKLLPKVDRLIIQYKENGTVEALVQSCIAKYVEMTKGAKPHQE